MIKTIKIILLPLFMTISTLTCNARNNDFAMWQYLSLRAKLSGRWNLRSDIEMRTKDNAKTVDRHSFFIEPSYTINPYLRAGVGYSIINNNKGNEKWDIRNRFNIYLTASYKTKDWNFAWRERYDEIHYSNSSTTSTSASPKRILRSRLQASFIKSDIITPYATIESYLLLNNSQYNIELERIRYTFGIDKRISNTFNFNLYYRFVDFKIGSSPNSHIIGCGLTYSIM